MGTRNGAEQSVASLRKTDRWPRAFIEGCEWVTEKIGRTADCSQGQSEWHDGPASLACCAKKSNRMTKHSLYYGEQIFPMQRVGNPRKGSMDNLTEDSVLWLGLEAVAVVLSER